MVDLVNLIGGNWAEGGGDEFASTSPHDPDVVVGRGRHHELLETCETYQEIVASQLSAEEAA